MAFGDRFDGTRIRGLDSFKLLFPYLCKTRTESVLYIKQQIDLTKTLAYLEKVNEGITEKKDKTTIFQIILCASVRAMAMRPQLNRFISGYRLYQRNQLTFGFIAKKQLNEEAKEVNVKIPFSPFETLSSIKTKINTHIYKAKNEVNVNEKEMNFFGFMPRFLIKFLIKFFRFLDYYNIMPRNMIKADPLYTSVYLANLGSVGIDVPYHHLFEWGNTSLFMAIGKIKKAYVVTKDNKAEVRDTLDLSFTLDDRVSEGIYCAKAIDIVKNFIENPELLEQKPEIDEKTLKELNLKDNYEESAYV